MQIDGRSRRVNLPRYLKNQDIIKDPKWKERKYLWSRESLKKISTMTGIFPVVVHHLKMQQCPPGDKSTVPQWKAVWTLYSGIVAHKLLVL